MNAVDMNQYIDRLKLEKELKDFIYKYKDSVYFKYADLIYNISLMLNGSIRGKYNENDFNDLPKHSNEEILKFVKDFYNKFSINYDIDDVLRNKVVYSEGNNGRPLIYGECNRSSNKIEINKTGTIIDSILLTHELGHYKNEREGLKNESKLFLSEILPMSEEFIMCDNLSGHDDEKLFWYKHRINSLYEKIRRINSLLGMIMVYINNGNLSREAYLSEFEEDYYVNDFNYLKDYINKHNLENIFMDMIYLIGYVMGINNMFKVRDNNSYIEVVSNAHDKVNDISVEDFFKLFGLDMEDMFYFDLVDNVLKFVGEVGIYPRKRLG